MKYKTLILVALLMFVVLTGMFIYKARGIFYDIESKLLSYLEDHYQIDIEVEDSTFWPVNRILLKNVKISSQDNGSSISTPELSIYYDFFSIINTVGSPAEAVNFISLDKPLLNINVEGDDPLQSENITVNDKDEGFDRWINILYSSSPFEIRIQDGTLLYSDQKNQLSLEEIDLHLKVIDEKECQIKLETRIDTEKIGWREYSLDSFNINDVKLTINLNNKYWQGNLETDFIDLDIFNKQLSELAYFKDNPYLNPGELRGRVKPVLSFSGNSSVLDNYSTSLILENVQTKFSLSRQETYTRLDSVENSDSSILNKLADSIGNNPTSSKERNILEGITGLLKKDKQDFIIKDMTGDISFDSNEDNISLNELEFVLNNNPFRLTASFNTGGNEIYGHLRSNQLDLTEIGILPDSINIDGLMAVDFTFEGFLPNLNMNLDFSLVEGNINGVRVGNLVSKARYYQGNTYLDQLNFILGDTGQFVISGIYNKNRDYSIDIDGRNIELELFNQLNITAISSPELPLPSAIEGKMNLSANITGNELKVDSLNTSGYLELINPGLYLADSDSTKQLSDGKFVFNKIESDFYISEKRLLLQEGRILSDWGEMSLSGELGLTAEKDMRLKIGSDLINLSELGNVLANSLDLAGFDETKLRADLEFDGFIEGNINSPILNIAVLSKEGSYNGVYYDNLSANINYNNSNFNVKDLNLNYQDTVISGDALITVNGETPHISSSLSSNSVDYSLAEGILRRYGILQTLPLAGDISIQLKMEGPINLPRMSINTGSTNTVLIINNNEISVDEFEISMLKKEEGFLLKEMFLRHGDGRLEADGVLSKEILDVKYNLANFPLQEIVEHFENIPIDGKLDGVSNLSGSFSGSPAAPLISGQIKTQGLSYQENSLGAVSGNVYYTEGGLTIDRLVWKNQEQEYIIDGMIENLLQEASLDLTVGTEYGLISDLSFINISEEIRNIFSEYYVRGQAHIGGKFDNIHTGLDFKLLKNTNSTDNIRISGNIDRELNLLIEGNNITIDNIMKRYSNASISGNLYFDGELTGTIDSYDLVLNTRIRDASLEENLIKNIDGSLEIKDASVFELDQLLIFSENSSLELKGSYLFEEGSDGINLSLDLERFPLELISLYNSSLPEISGLLSGDVELLGGLNEPVLNGKLRLAEGKFDFALPDKFSNLGGNITLSNQTLTLDQLTGNYGDGEILLEGLINPFAETNTVNLSLTGNDLPLDYGSIDGRFDADAEINGTFKLPVIEAELLAHNLDISLPFEWPKMEGEGNWSYDLFIYPGDEVYLTNDNINVLIQEGNLRIHNLNEQLEITGVVSSNQGTFDYYNNKFILEKGEASFEKSFLETDRYVPRISANAWTNVQGTRINVQLNGRANNMVATFTSLPSLSQEEILTLLTSRGGIGEFATGNYEEVIQSEFMRWIHTQIQLDFVSDLQESLKKVFELDRFEVDTYNIGWNNQVSIYIGKYLNRRLYLEYTDIIGPDNRDFLSNSEGELRLQYLLDDNIVLESGWQGEDNYSLSIETNFQF